MKLICWAGRWRRGSRCGRGRRADRAEEDRRGDQQPPGQHPPRRAVAVGQHDLAAAGRLRAARALPAAHVRHGAQRVPGAHAVQDLVERRVDGGADQDGDGDEVEPEQDGDRRGQRPVDRPRVGGRRLEHGAQHVAADHPGDQGEDGAGEVEPPAGPHRHRDVVERGQEADAQHRDHRPVEVQDEVPPVRQRVVDQARPGHHQRDGRDPGDQGEHVEAEGERPGRMIPRLPPSPCMIVMVSMKTLSAREPDQSASTKPTEMTSNRPPLRTSSRVGSMMLGGRGR